MKQPNNCCHKCKVREKKVVGCVRCRERFGTKACLERAEPMCTKCKYFQIKTNKKQKGNDNGHCKAIHPVSE